MWEQVMGENPSRHQLDDELVQAEDLEGQDLSKFPVEMVTWPMAVEFCEKLSELPEEKAAGRVYTLPTEAQWEYACRAGTTTYTHFGNELTSHIANIKYDDPFPKSAEFGPKLNRPAEVGSYEPNAWGLYDMHGNVQEWCFDSWRTLEGGEVHDPTSDADDPEWRTVRGGSYRTLGYYAISPVRNKYRMPAKQPDYGLRVIIQL